MILLELFISKHTLTALLGPSSLINISNTTKPKLKIHY